ncbi:hypothetical protein ONZ45_g4256 [Pleurotus djamor]|nr:hypothetical protein ONZ45_g4256 [Pleurotus djamor]
MSDKANVHRRYADTGILTYSMIACPVSRNAHFTNAPTDPRSMIALSRINWMHEKYPIAWTDRYGWRKLSHMEQEVCVGVLNLALLIFWSEIGKRMNIKDIPKTLEELKTWSKSYEPRARSRAITNKNLVDFTYDTGASAYPRLLGIRRFYRGLLVCFLDEECRLFTMQPKQPWYIHTLGACVLHGMKYYNRYLAFPRLRPSTLVPLEPPAVREDDELRMHPTTYEFFPWYKAEGRGLDWLQDSLLYWLDLRGSTPGKDLMSQGYRLEEVGPPRWEKSGHDEVFSAAESMFGCPIEAPWKPASKSE